MRRPASVRTVVTRALLGLLLVAGLVVVARGAGFPRARVDAQDGLAWLVSSRVGQVSLVDGASGKVVTQVAVAPPGGPLSSVQAGPDAYVGDAAAGTLARVDGTTLRMSGRVPVTAPGTEPEVVPGRGNLYVVDRGRQLVTSLDPATLRPREGERSLAVSARDARGVADAEGRLWVLDGGTRRLSRVDARGGSTARALARSSRSRLVVAGGEVVSVDLADGSARLLDREGRPRGSACLDVAADDTTVRLAPSSAARQVVAVSGSRGLVLLARLPDGGCDARVELGVRDHALGVPRELAGRLFVPDYTDGVVHVVDLARRTVIARADLRTGRAEFALQPQGRFVFYNDPASARAGVIRLDGQVTAVRKYDPESPGGRTPSLPPSLPPPPPERPSPGRADAQVRIAVSADVVEVGREVTLTVLERSGAVVRGAQWDLGDGSTADGPLVRHRWSAAGEYTVSAVATLGSGATVRPQATIRVTDHPAPPPPPFPAPPTAGPPEPVPTAPAPGTTVSITASTTTPVAGRAVEFGLRSADGTQPTGATWGFGDGTTDTGTAPTHTWSSEGTYGVTADAVLPDGTRVAATPLTVTVTPRPTARIVASSQRAAVDEIVQFRLDANSGTPESAAWTFGDGQGSGALSPSHAWAASGDYRVTAEVTFTDGTAVTAPPVAITVTDRPPGAPNQLTPADGTVFTNVPRTTTVTWAAVPGSIHYEVEVEYQDPGGGPWRPWTSNHDLADTSWTFDFAGAQPGRWRVAAADANGRVHWSGWWGFSYSR
jgi:chitodextrinase